LGESIQGFGARIDSSPQATVLQPYALDAFATPSPKGNMTGPVGQELTGLIETEHSFSVQHGHDFNTPTEGEQLWHKHLTQIVS
jgi:hypothetical protein